MAKKIRVTETALRDAHQSLIATRMTTEEMLPVLEKLDKIGYYSLECWGGATYDSCLRFLNEDPWDRLRTIREHCPNTKLQMILIEGEKKKSIIKNRMFLRSMWGDDILIFNRE